MNDLTQFEYEGQYISFEFTDGSKMINATEMAKPFKGKMVGGFLRLQGTKDFIALLERRYADMHIADNQPTREVLRVVKGGLGYQGTWMDERLALKFAAWLSPLFEMWVYDRIYELLTTGQTELQRHKALPVVDALRAIADHLEAQETDTDIMFQSSQDTEYDNRDLQWHISKITDNIDEVRNLLDTIPEQKPQRNRLNDIKPD